jgi:hypothetical protein
MLTNNDVKQLTVDLFKQRSDRDKQHKVGASNISNPCTRHLAHDLLGTPEAEFKYWMGGKIGTAIHSFLESAIDSSGSAIFDGCVVEQKITLGEIPGYGVVNSKPDLVLPNSNHLIDWKTTSRAKVKKLQNVVDGVKQDAESLYTLQKYVGQAQLYAWGLNQAGTKIDRSTLVFINRDGTYENDIWTYTFDYDEAIAVALWDRVNAIWGELQDGAHPNDYPNDEHCFKCSMGI